MNFYKISDMEIEPEKTGAQQYIKISYPFRYGCFGEIRTPEHIFGFNLNGEITTIQGRSGGWLETTEWLKRSAGNDWAYFAAGGYNGAYNYTGEYYIPCLDYQTNTIFGQDKFKEKGVINAFHALHKLMQKLNDLNTRGLPGPIVDFINRVRKFSLPELEKRAKAFRAITGGPIPVLPPDARHVEYNVIPIIIADGCLYNCGFCRVKSGAGFKARTRKAIKSQIYALKSFYGKDLPNYNSIFLGEHDALFAGGDLISFAAENAYDILQFETAVMKEPRLFMFGSADALLGADDALFEMLNKLPFFTHINIGLESGDPKTLAKLRKPISAEKVEAAFLRMIDINRACNNLEISANFVIGEDLPDSHLPLTLELTTKHLTHRYPKGDLYLSPLESMGPKEKLLSQFNEFKRLCRLPAYLYLIQRL